MGEDTAEIHSRWDYHVLPDWFIPLPVLDCIFLLAETKLLLGVPCGCWGSLLNHRVCADLGQCLICIPECLQVHPEGC